MNNEKVSLIVPVYNIEKYIKKCINSIINQDYKNLEVLIIDDGSTDNSKIIIDNYVKKDERIKYFYKENGGLSSARNFGLMKATGDYVCFIDGDDWITQNYVSENLKIIKQDNSDMVISNIEYIYDNDTLKKRVPKIKYNKCISKSAALKKLLNGDEYKFHIVNKFCKREIYINNNILFPLNMIYEDMFTSYKLFLYSNKISLCNKNLYYYLQCRTGSILNTKFNQKRFDVLKAMDIIINDKTIIENTNISDRQNYYLINILSLASYLYVLESKKEIKKYLNIIYEDNNYKILKGFIFNKNIKMINKLKMIAFMTNPYIYLKILKKNKEW